MKKQLGVIVFILTFVLIFCQAVAAEDLNSTGNQISVNNNSKIQDAINNASSGDTIIVNPGTYNENIVLNKTNLTLKSNGSVTINASNVNTPVVYINSLGKNTRIKGFTITGATGSNGIYLNGASNCVIYANNIFSNKNGIYLDSSNNNQILDNTVTGNTGYGIFTNSMNTTVSGNTVTGTGSEGIVVYGSSSHILHNNVTNNTGTGVRVNDGGNAYGHPSSSNITVTNNNVSSNSNGIIMYYCNNSTISGNIAAGERGTGVYVSGDNVIVTGDNIIHDIGGDGLVVYGSNVNITGLTIYNVTGTGIRVNDGGDAYGHPSSSNVTVTNNTVTGSGKGIIMYYCNNSKIIGNTATGNRGAGVYASGDYSTISGNTVTNDSGTGLEVRGNNVIITPDNVIHDVGGDGLVVYGSNILINGFNIYNVTGTGIRFNDPGNAYGHPSSSNVTVSNNNVSGNGNGIIMYYCNNVTISGNVATGEKSTGIYIKGDNAVITSDNIIHDIGGDGLVVYGSNVNITGLTIYNVTGTGIRVNDGGDAYGHPSSSNVTVTNNIVSGNGNGIIMYYCNNSTVSGNVAAGERGTGIYVSGDNVVITSDNVIHDVGGDGLVVYGSNVNITGLSIYNVTGTGIRFNDAGNVYGHPSSSNVIVSNNTVTGSGKGIIVYYCNNSTVSGNTATGNRGAGVYASGDYSTISGNTVTNDSGTGLEVRGNNVIITSDNVIHDVGGDGLVVYGSNILINGFNIYNVSTGIRVNDPGNVYGHPSSSNVTVSNNTVTGSGNGIIMYYCNNSTISGNIITGERGTGIYVSGDNVVITSDNVIHDVGGDGLVVYGSNVNITGLSIYNVTGTGIRFNDAGNVYGHPSSSNVTIANNNVSGSGSGIVMYYCSNSTVSWNTVTKNNIGIYIIGSNSIFSNNTILNCTTGILLSSSSNTISENNISNNNIGISLASSSNNMISRNKILNNTVYGIKAYRSSDKITENEITGNVNGIYIEGSSGNTFSNNNITNNTDAGIFINSASGNTVLENIISNNTNYGIRVKSSSSNDLVKNNISNSTDGIYFESSTANMSFNNIIKHNGNGVRFSGSSYNNIFNCVILNNTNYDINMVNSPTKFMLSTYDESKIFLQNSAMTVLSDLYIKVLDKNGNPVEGAQVTVKNKNNAVIGQGVTSSLGLVKIDNPEHTQNSSGAPYLITVLFENQTYPFQNNITQRAMGYPMGPVECILSVNDPRYSLIAIGGSGGSSGSGDSGSGSGDSGSGSGSGSGDTGSGGSGGSGGSNGGSNEDCGAEDPDSCTGPGTSIIPPSIYIDIPPADSKRGDTPVHYNMWTVQDVYIYNLSNKYKVGPLLVRAKIDSIFKIDKIVLWSVDGDYAGTLFDVATEGYSTNDTIVWIGGINPLGCAHLKIFFSAGSPPSKDARETSGHIDVTVIDILSDVSYNMVRDSESRKLCGKHWDQQVRDVTSQVMIDTVIQGDLSEIISFFGNPLGSVINYIRDSHSLFSGVITSIQMDQTSVEITKRTIDVAGTMNTETVRAHITWNPDIQPGINMTEYQEYFIDITQVRFARQATGAVRAFDPNVKSGPGGSGSEGFIPYLLNLPYTIRFENVANASAPAQKVIITDYLDSDLDWSTFEFGDVSFGNITVPVWQNIVDLRPNQNLLVKINRSINYTTGLVTWTFESIDPNTGMAPTNPMIGFLPPNVNYPEGEGLVQYTIRPKLNLTSGTEIRNKASIIFDTNDPIETNEVLNTLDTQGPTSSVNQLPARSSHEFEVSWSGNDGNGSGIAQYMIFVSENNGTYHLWLKTNETSAIFTGIPGSTYRFFSIAIDNVGNIQNLPFEPDAITVVNQPPVANTTGPYTGNEGSPITLDASSSSDPDGDNLRYRWDFNNDGIWDTEWSTSPTVTYTWDNDWNGTVGLEVSDGNLTNVTTVNVAVNNVAPIVNAGENQTVNEGDTVNFNGSFIDPGLNDTQTVLWDFGDGTTGSGTLTPTHKYLDNGSYKVTLTVTDNDGGIGISNLTVIVNNITPTVNAGENQTINEGDTVSFNGNFVDPGLNDIQTITWDFGDGTTRSGTLTPTHKYLDNGTYIVTLTVTDKDGGVGKDKLTITVNNSVPVVNAGYNITTSEGKEVNFDGNFTDAGSLDTHTILWNFGDGTSASGNLKPTHIYADNGSYKVTLTVTDNDGGIGISSLIVLVENVAPVVFAGQNVTASEGNTVNFDGTFIDPGILDTHTILWDFGDGTTASGTLTPIHVYYDNGTYTVTLTVTDNDGDSGVGYFTTLIENVAPIVNAGENQSVNEGGTVNFNGSFIDPGLNDTQTVLWDFGDGTTATGILTPTHKYANDGIYNVTLTVKDKDGGIGTSNLVVTVKPAVVKPISATVNIDPDTLNLNSNGKWITAYITLPKGYDIHNVDADTIKLQYGGRSISAAKVTVECGVLVVKFDRAKVQSLFSKSINNATITVTGKVLYNGSYVDFAGSDIIKFTDKRGSCDLEKWFKSLFDLLGDILTIF